MYRDSAGNYGAHMTRYEHACVLFRALPISTSHETDRCSGWDMGVMQQNSYTCVYKNSRDVLWKSDIGFACSSIVPHSAVNKQHSGFTCSAWKTKTVLRNDSEHA